MKYLKFVLGWIIWSIIFTISLLFNVITWNWKETVFLDMEVIVSEICGKSTWEIMTGKYGKS